MRETRMITEGAVLAAIVTIILLLTFYVPVIGSFTIWALSLPFTVFTYRKGLKAGFILLFVSCFIAFVIGIGGGLAIVPTFMFGSAGLVIGEMHRRGKNGFSVLLGASLLFIVHILLSYIVMTFVLNSNPMQLAIDLTKEQMEMTESTLVSFGQESNIEVLEERLDLLIYMAPVVIVGTAVALALISTLLGYFVLRKLRHKVQALPPFREWQFPKSFLWYYLIVMILSFSAVEEGSTLFVIVWNLFPLLEVVLAVQGFSFIFFYCHKKKIAKAIPILLIVASLVIMPLLHLVRVLGILDLGFGLRKRIESQKK